MPQIIATNIAITPKKRIKLTPKERIIVKHYDPQKTNFENFKDLDKKGLVTMQHGYRRLGKSELLVASIDAIHAHWESVIHAELMPLATKNIKKRLKSKDIDTFRDDKLVLDTYAKRTEPPKVQVNFTQINQLRELLGSSPATRTEDDNVVDI